jgi:hypothetical protein
MQRKICGMQAVEKEGAHLTACHEIHRSRIFEFQSSAYSIGRNHDFITVEINIFLAMVFLNTSNRRQPKERIDQHSLFLPPGPD